MKNKKFWIPALGVLFLSAPAFISYAEIGQIDTRRGRKAVQSSRSYSTSTSSSSSSAPAGKKAYQVIHENFLNEQYASVDTLANQYLSQNPRAADANDVLYLQALSLLKLNRSEEAREKLRQLEASAPNPEIKAAASASIGDSYYYEGSHTRAYESYKETMRKYPASDQKEYLRDRLLELSAEFGYTTIKPMPNNLPLTSRLKQTAFEETSFYSVQVGSFSRSKNAEGLVRKLVQQGYEAYVADEKSHGMTRVRVGHFSTKAQAASTEARLKREGYPTKIVP